ncbi:MAG TPA: hypothetical protein DCE42_13080 [Myxococcales bacterium]|nr:hypothetical protein [Myxococcales bacterium]
MPSKKDPWISALWSSLFPTGGSCYKRNTNRPTRRRIEMSINKRCFRDPTVYADWECMSCGKGFSDMYAQRLKETRDVMGRMLVVCTECGELCRPIDADHQVEKPMKEWLIEAFTLPFASDNLPLLIAGGLVYAFLMASASNILIAIMLLGWIGYFGAYMMDIIAHTAQGGDELPDWPELSTVIDSLLKPILLLLAALLISFAAPTWLFTTTLGPAGVYLAMLFGALYFPMTLIAISIYRSFLAINPATVIISILKIPGTYLLASLFFFVLLFVESLGRGILFGESNAIFQFMGSLIGFYFLLVEMRILGMIYRTNKYTLNWLGEAD